MRCRDVMLNLVYTCPENGSVLECARKMRDEKIGFIPVTSADGKLVGVLTDRDITVRVVAENKPFTIPVKEVMSIGELVTCTPDDDLVFLEKRMASEKKSRAVVLEKGQLVGVISLSDIARAETSARRTGALLRDVTQRESVAIARP
jgi:CBS domain-containing protein